METRSVYLLTGSSSSHVLLRDTLERLFRRKYRTFFLLFLWTAAMGAYVWFSPPDYEDEIQFFINNNRAGTVVTPEYNNGPVPRDYIDEAAVATEIQLLSNADLLRSVVVQCGLADSANGMAVEKAVEQLQKKLKVSPVLKANMIKASYSASNPQEVQAVLRTLAKGYMDEHVLAHGSRGAYELFDKQANFYKQRLQELQDGLTEFQQGRSIVALGEQKDLNLRKLLELQAAYKDNEAARVANTRKIGRLTEKLAKLDPRITTQARQVPNQYSVERLNTMLVELQNRRTELLAKFQPHDRLVAEVDKQIADTKASLDRADRMSSTEETTDVNPIRQSLDAELAKAELGETEYQAHEASLQKEIADYGRSLSTLQNATTDDDQRMRDIKQTEENFFLYSKKREEARIEEAMDQQRIANAVLVKSARLPALPKPRVSLTLAAAYVLGCLLLLAFTFTSELARSAVYTPWELEGLTGLPVLANVPIQRIPSSARAKVLAIPEFIP